jgi:hypothetical protein
LPSTDPEIAGSLIHLGSVELARGKTPEAISLLREGLGVYEAAFFDTPRHPRRVNSARRLAVALMVAQKRREAQAVVARYPNDLLFAAINSEALAINEKHAGSRPN